MPRSPLPPAPDNSGVIVGLKNIGKVFGRGVHAARDLIAKHGLPARRLPDGSWVTSTRLIDAWIDARQGQKLEHRPPD